jgi:hypothetical protein
MVVETGSAPISGAGQETYRLSADGLDQGEEGASSCALQRECRVAGPRLVILAGASIVGRPSWSVPSHPACRRHPDLQH